MLGSGWCRRSKRGGMRAAGRPRRAERQLPGTARRWATEPEGSRTAVCCAPKSLDQVYAAARNSQPQAFALRVTAKIHTVSRLTRIESRNIVAELHGSDPKLRDQYVVYTAHVDHLAMCNPVEGDNVCHGAIENASGTSDALEVARAFASLPQPPRRSILFVFVTGEELGLLGSDHFAHYPTVARAQIVANINLDGAPGILYPLRDIWLWGRSTLQ